MTPGLRRSAVTWAIRDKGYSQRHVASLRVRRYLASVAPPAEGLRKALVHFDGLNDGRMPFPFWF